MEPETRKEAYLAAIAGEDVTLPIPVTRTEYYLNKIATKPAELPEVTDEDNGDVMTVVDGAWGKATPSGGGGMLKITCTIGGDVPVINKTWQEIHDAEGAYVYINDGVNQVQFFWYLVQCSVDKDGYLVVFYDPGNSALINFTASAANDIPVYTGTP